MARPKKRAAKHSRTSRMHPDSSPGKPVVVLTHWVHPPVLERLSHFANVIANDSRDSWTRSELHRHLASAEAVMVFMPDCVDAAFLDAAPKLKIVAGALKGFDNLDLDACAQRGVWVSNVPGALTVPTAELAIGLLLALTRRIVPGDARVREKGYDGWRPVLYGDGLAGKTVGIVGFGAVGQTIAQRLLGFDVNVAYYDQRRPSPEREEDLDVTYSPLRSLLKHCDHLILAAPLTPQTEHLLDAESLAQLKPGVNLVNIGRGSVVDERAIAAALRSGHLAGYAADVFEFEDLSRTGRPRGIHPDLLAFPARTVFTPHLGSAVDEIRLRIAMEAAENIIDVLRGGAPRSAVNEISNAATAD